MIRDRIQKVVQDIVINKVFFYALGAMIANVSIALTLFQTAHSVLESGMYAIIDSRKNLPACIQKVSSCIIERFQELQNFFSSVDYLAFVPRTLLPVTKFATEMPKIFLYTSGIGNLTLLFIRILWAKVESQSKRVENCLLTRIMNIAFNAIILVYFNIYPSLILVGSLIGIAASLYSFYKNRQFKWIAVDRAINLPVDETQQVIQGNIQAITKLFRDQRIPFQEAQPVRAHAPFALSLPNFLDFFPQNNSLRARIEHELRQLENEEGFQGSPGTLIAFYINKKLKQLVESMHEFDSMEIAERRREILFRWSDRFLDPAIAQIAKMRINQLILLTNLRLRKVELSAEVFVEKNENRDTICPFCLENNSNLQICGNGHSSHENCFRQYLTTNLDRFLPGNGNQYILIHTDHYADRFGTQEFFRTSHKYSVQISPNNAMSCPTCRGGFLSSKFGVKKIEDIKYGIIENNHLVIEEPALVPAV